MAERPPPRDGESTAARWSRRKHQARRHDETQTDSEPQETPATSENRTEEDQQADVVASLPPIESLTAESDFTPFLDRAVPAELRRLALRKLWLSDPVLANLDGLNDYNDDFRSLGVGKIVRTAYEVGKGLVTKAEKAAAEIRDEAANESAVGTAGQRASTSDASGHDVIDDDAEEA